MIIETIYRALETLRLLTSFHGTLTFHEVAKPTWTDPNLWLAPVATLCSALLALFAAYLTIKKMRKQISLSDQHLSETQKTRKIAAKLDIAKDAKKQLSEISTSITPTNDKMMDLLIQKLKVEGKISETPETNISYAHDFGQKISIICVTGQSGTHNTTIPFIGPIGIIFSAIDMLGAVEARKKYLNPQDDFFQIRAQIRSYINILEILILTTEDLLMEGYDFTDAAALVANSQHPAELLHQIGAINISFLGRLKRISCFSSVRPRPFKLDLRETLLIDLKQNMDISEALSATDIAVNIKPFDDQQNQNFIVETLTSPKRKFIKRYGEWREVTGQESS